ncbi:MAG: glycosyltransferase family 4 protein [Steroidobacteraceae bacterium]
MSSTEIKRPRMGRVLASAYVYQPDGVSEGWTASQIVSSLRQKGWRMTVFSAALPRMRFTQGLVRIQCKTNADVPYFSLGNYLEYSVRTLIAARRLRRMFDIVHHVSPIVMRVPSFMGLLGRPFIWGPVGGSIPFPPGFERYGRPSNWVNALRRLDRPRLLLDPTMRLTMISADRIIVTTSAAAALIPDAYRVKTSIIPEGIPRSAVLAAPPPEEPYIFSSGRLILYKAMDVIIKAFALMKSTDVKLLITGDGPKRPELLALIDRLGLKNRVQLLGRVTRTRNAELMSRSLFCAFPALREAFGHVNLEAMAAWKPVVVTDWGGPRDLVVNGVTGIKVLGRNPAEHIEMFAAAMDHLVIDSEMRRSMGAAAAQRILENFTWSVLGAQYDELYRQVSR